MVLKINNNLITPSHIIEGEKVNDTYFEGKYHLMLPNSEERFLTSVSERKQLLNESLRSNLYDRKTKRTIVNNTTTGNMFEEYMLVKVKKTFSNFSNNNFLSIDKTIKGNFEITGSFKINSASSSSLTYHIIRFTAENSSNNFLVYIANNRFAIWNDETQQYLESSKYASVEKFFFKITRTNNSFSLYISTDKNNFGNPLLTTSLSGDIVKIGIGGQGSTRPFSIGEICINEYDITQNNQKIFDGENIVEGIDYTVVGTLTVSEEYIRTRAVTQKPFTQSVTINSSEIQEGTKYLVDYPGMFQLKTEDNTLAVKFLFDENPVWKYIKQEELVEGDNVLSLVSDTEKLKFVVNTTEHILVDSTLTEEVRCFVNNSTENNYWQLINPFNPGENEWEISFDFYSGTGGRGAQGIFINEVSDQYGTRIGMSSGYFSFLNGNGSWINASSYYGGDRIEDNKLYHVQAGYKNNNYYIKHSFDGNEYKTDVSYNSSRKISSVKSKIGTIYNASGVKFYIDTLKIIVGNEVVFNGKTAVEGVDYTVVGSPTIETEIIHIGGEIPELTAGYLGYREGWKL